MFTVLQNRKNHRGMIVFDVIHLDGQQETVTMSQIYGGLAWPSGEAPAYHCFLGEKFIGTKEGEPVRGKIILLSEAEHLGISLDQIFARLTDDAARFGCSTILTKTDEKYIDFVTAFQDWSYANHSNMARLSIEQAPFADEFRVGLAIADNFLRSGRAEINSGGIFNQLKEISRSALSTAAPEEKFHALNSFRFAIAGFYKFKPSLRSNRRRARTALSL